MIHCPQCGAANSEQSKFCGECGAKLPTLSGGVRCPMCSHNNPLGSQVCERCNARLVPLAAPSPPREPSAATPGALPSAPSGLTRTPGAEITSGAVPPGEAPSTARDESDTEASDWLQRMRASASVEEPPSVDSAAVPTGPSDRPDWLSRLGPEPKSEPSVERESVPSPVEDETPDWLARVTPAEAEPAEPSPAEGEVPDWLAELAPTETEPAELPPAETEAQVPDWLARVTPAEAEPAEPPPAGGEVPDWLAELAPVEVESAAPAPAEGEAPDWLAEMAPAETEPVESPPAGAEAQVPDWLAEIAAAEVEPAVPPTVEAEAPDWLAEMAPAEAEAAVPAPAEGEVPDWLAEMAPAEVEAAAPAPAEGEVPDWLAEMAPAEAEAAAPAPAEGEVPDWLATMMPAEAEPVEPSPEPGEEVPDWLAALMKPGGAEPVSSTEEVGVVAEAEPSPSLAEAQRPAELTTVPLPSAEEAALLQPTELERGEGVTADELPDWVAQLKPAETTPMPQGSGLAQAEIPGWLQAMRPGVAPALPPKEEEMEVEASGLLAGIAGVIQAASVIAVPVSAPARPEPISAEATLARANLWQQLVARSAQPSPIQLPQARVTRARDRVERWLVYGVVAVAVLIPILAGVDLLSMFSLEEPLTAEAGAAYDFIDDTVVKDAPVLIAFDYDPSYMGELYPQAEALLHHLADLQARVFAVSLKPEAAGLAQQLLDDVLGTQGYQSGQDYVNLGYLPGEAMGIRSLEFLPWQSQGETFDGEDLKDASVFGGDAEFTLSKTALVVVLTGDANNVREWVEQKSAVERKMEGDLPLVAGVSAAIEPLVRPYYDMQSRQIDGLVVGLAGAVDYEDKLDWTDGPAHIRVSGQLVGQVTVPALILIGMLIYGLLRRSDTVDEETA